MRSSERHRPITRLAAMRGRLHNWLLVCAFALTLAGCGSGDDGTIPEDEAGDLLSVLEAMQNQLEEGECDLVDENAEEFLSRVNALPGDVDPEVAGELTRAGERLSELAGDPDQCATGASGEEGPEPTDTTETDTSVETTTTETTTDEESTTTDEEPAEEDEEPSEDDQPPEPPSPEPDLPPEGGDEGGGSNVTPTPDPDLEGPPSGGVQPGGDKG
jgi:hypothetical protein